MAIFQHDRALLDAFRRGDRDALERIYYHYVDDVERLVRRGFAVRGDSRGFVPGYADASAQRDAIQEVFLRAFGVAARTGYDGLRPFRPYLLRIARNWMIDRARASGRTSLEVPDDAIDLDAVLERDAPFEKDAAGKSIDWNRMREATLEYIATLAPDDQRFIALRFDDELPQLAVADAMGITRRKVRTMEKRLYKGLRRHLRSRGLRST